MRVYTRTLSGRLSRKSSLFLENMAKEDNQSLHNENNCVRKLRDYMNPTRTSARSCIIFPPDASHFNFKLGIIQLLLTFHGLDLENPYFYLREFEEVCNTYNDLNCSINTIRLKLFSFSLKDKVKTWLQNLRSGSIRACDERSFFRLTKQTLSKDKSLLSLKNQDKNFINVGIGIETCLILTLIMVLKYGDWFHIFVKG
jgi:hypothetical protein